MHVKVPTDVEVDEDFVIIVDILPTDATGKVTITINGENFTGEVKDGIAYVEIDGLDSAASYEVKVNYSGDNKYTGSTDTTYITISRISDYDMTINVPKDAKVGENAIIEVTVSGEAQGDVIISVDGVDYKATISNNIASITLNNLTAGNHTIAAKYDGDNKYAPNYATGNITVSKVSDYKFNITADPIKVGQDAIIIVNVPVDAEGKIILYIDGSMTQGDAADIIGGVATFNVAGLGNGTHTITATFDGDDKYVYGELTGTITVSKVNECSMNISVSGDVKVGDKAVINVALPADATGNVTIKVGNKTYNTTAKDGVATITTDEITEAIKYDVSVTYEGDDKYNLVTDKYSFTASQVNPTMNITASNIVYTENETISINLPEDVNGNAIIFVDGQQSLTVDVINGKASGSISGLTAGNHTIAVDYNGNNKYTKISENVIINVAKANSKLDVNIDDVVYNGVFIINATLTNLNDAQLDGTVVVTINGNPYNVVVKNGNGSIEGITLNANDYYFTAKWNGDNNYNGAETTGKFNVAQANPTLNVNIKDVNYGEIFKITATLAGVGDTPLNGFVSVIVNGEEYIVRVVDGEGVLNGTKLPADSSYDFTATWEGNNNYNEVTDIGSFSVAKVNPTLNVNIADVNYGEIFKITATLAGVEDDTPLNGFVTVIVADEEYTVRVVNGEGVLNGIKLPAASSYDFTAVWEGDNNYNGVEDTGSFGVAKVNPEFSISVEDIKVGEGETINFSLPDDATGDVTITVGNTSYTVSVEDAMKVISDLKAGNYTAIVTYKGDNNYNSVTSECNFTVSKNDPDMKYIYYPGMEYGTDSDIMIILPADATGNVTVTIDGTSYPIEMDDGFGYVRIPTLDAGNYNFTISYAGNDKYESSVIEGNFDVFKVDPTFNVVIDNNVYGKNSTIVATLNGVNNSPLTGNVVVTINNKNYTIIVVDGKGILNNVQLSAGDYNFTAMWDGNNNYNSVQDTGSFNIAKIDPNINVLANDINVGDDEEITVFLPEDVTGEVIITVNEVDYKVKVENGIAKQVISGLKTENETSLTYLVHVKYLGDNNYNNITALDEMFTVSKISGYNINITVPSDVKVGDEATINVSLPSDATGNVTVNIDGINYNASLHNGVASVNVANLTAGEHNIVVKYIGDDKYNSESNFDVIDVSKVTQYPITINVPDDVKYGDKAVINVTLPSDADGVVEVTIGNKTYEAIVKGGKASITTDELTTGIYSVNVTYNGNGKYAGKNSTQEMIVNKITDYNMTMDIPADINNNANNTITVGGLPKDATGNVTITIGDDDYTAKVENGSASITIPPLEVGEYNITTTYSGDDKYTSASNKTAVVSRDGKYNMNVTIPDEVKTGDDTTISIDFPEDATGNVTVTIDDQKYTEKVENGSVEITVPSLPVDEYDVTIDYSGDGKYLPSSVNKTLEVISGDVNLTADDVVMIYKDGSRLYAVLLDAKGNPIADATISFAINNVKYNRTTDENGSASIALNLDSGVYDVVISYAGNKTYNPASVNATVEVKSSIISDDLVKMYQNDTQFYATFLGKDGKVLANTTVRFNINGVFYNRTTDENGTARLAINLNPGNYTLTAYNPINGEEKGFNVLVKSLIESNDLTKYYQNASKFEAKIYNKDGSIAANKTVTFNVNGVFYTRTTDENGTVKLAINLKPGNYTITTMYDGLSVGNKVCVLPTLETADLSMVSGDGSSFQAKTLDGQGNPLANQSVTFNVNGVFYHRTTSDDGIAKLTINLARGQYTITSIWDSYQIGNKISIS